MDIRLGDKIVFKKLEEMPVNMMTHYAMREYTSQAASRVLTVKGYHDSMYGKDFLFVYFKENVTPLFNTLQVCDDMIDYIIRDQENVQYEDSEDLSDFLGSFKVVP